MKKTIPAIACLLLMAGLHDVRAACDCPIRLSPGDAYNRAAGVFVGLVKRVEPDAAGKDQAGGNTSAGGNANAEQIAYIQVEKAYKGVNPGDIVLYQPDDDCAPKFRVGQRWLFYASHHDVSDAWSVPGCSRSRGIDFAHDDLLYLGGLPQSATQTRISGVVSQYEQSPETGFSFVKNIAGTKVKIAGLDKTYEAVTDKNGVYEIYGLAAGHYTIQIDPPSGLRIRFPVPFGPTGLPEGDALTMDLKPGGSTGADFVVSSDSTVSGRVLDPSGQPLPNICVDLIPSSGPPKGPFRIQDCTKQDGSYQLNQIPPGDYLIVAHPSRKPSASEPYQRWFYPGVLARNRATVVTMAQGAKLEAYDIRIPRKLPTTTLQGVLSFSDGKPVAREQISFRADAGNPNPGIDRDSSAITDDQGRFTILIIQGSAGSLLGAMYVSESKFPDCTEIKKRLEAKQRGSLEVETDPIRIDSITDTSNIKLVFPFPGCEKKN